MANSGFRTFIGSFLVACVGLLAVGSVGLYGLDKLGRLPPPPLTVTNCIDEKFMFMREQAPRQPDLIAVGSSVTWRNLDFSVVDQSETGSAAPVNAAPCFLQVHQTAFLTDFYLDNLPTVNTVLTVFAMRDFEDCDQEGEFFNTFLAGIYVVQRMPAVLVYFANFRPLQFMADVGAIKQMRSGEIMRASLMMDDYGSGPLLLEPPEIREDVHVSPACLPPLAQMEVDLAERGIRWIVVLMPPMPAWIDHYDPGGTRDRGWREAVKATLREPTTVLLDGAESPFVETWHFTDPAHFHWDHVPEFTRWVFEQANSGRKPTQVGSR